MKKKLKKYLLVAGCNVHQCTKSLIIIFEFSISEFGFHYFDRGLKLYSKPYSRRNNSKKFNGDL